MIESRTGNIKDVNISTYFCSIRSTFSLKDNTRNALLTVTVVPSKEIVLELGIKKTIIACLMRVLKIHSLRLSAIHRHLLENLL